jgi:hypothetical protein
MNRSRRLTKLPRRRNLKNLKRQIRRKLQRRNPRRIKVAT